MLRQENAGGEGGQEELVPGEVSDVGEVEGVEVLRKVVCHVLHTRAPHTLSGCAYTRMSARTHARMPTT